jgi:hypothetical protein
MDLITMGRKDIEQETVEKELSKLLEITLNLEHELDLMDYREYKN